MADTITQAKWDKLAPRFDGMAAKGAEKRWKPFKEAPVSYTHLTLPTNREV